MNFDVELLVGNWGSGKFYVSDFTSFEVDNGLHNEDEWLFEHVQPSRLCFDVTLNTRLSISWLEIIAWVDNVDLAACLNQINKNLEQVTIVFRFELFQVWIFIGYLRMNFCFDFNLQIFFDLNDDVTINCLSLIQWLIFVELEYNGHLRFVSHWQNEAFVDMFVVHIVTIRGAMKPEILFVEVNCVFASWDGQVYIDQCCDWISSKLTDFGFFSDSFIKGLSVRFLLFIILLIFALFFFVFHIVLIFGLIDVESDLAHAVLITKFLDGGFDNDVIFIDSNIFHIIEGDAEHLVVGHWKELQLLWTQVEFSVMNSFKGH